MHGFSAMAPEDKADARRRHPAVTLEAWAAQHGLRWIGRGTAPGLEAGLPEHPEYMHNLVHGPLPGGREGALFHELLQTHFQGDSQLPGSYYGRMLVSSPGGLKRALRPDRTWLPGVGAFLSDPNERPDEAFGTHGAWAPCTSVAVALPEAAAVLPTLHALVRTRARGVRGHGERSVGRFRLTINPSRTSEEAVAALTAAGFITILESLGGSYLDARLKDGVLRVRRNGYTVDPAELDRFARGVAAAAAAIASVATSATPLPAPEPGAPGTPDSPIETQVKAGFTLDLSRLRRKRKQA